MQPSDTADTAGSGASKMASPPPSPLVVYDEISNCLSKTTKNNSPSPKADRTREEQISQVREESIAPQESGAGPTNDEQKHKVSEAANIFQSTAVHKSNEGQISQSKEASDIPKTLGVDATNELEKPQHNGETKIPERFDFELHYGLSSRTFGGVLREILSDMSTYKHIHNWDEKLFTGPLKAVLKAVHRSWGENRCTLTSLQTHSTVEESLNVSESHNAPPAIQEAGDVDSHLFFTKRTSGKDGDTLSPSQKPKNQLDKTSPDKSLSKEVKNELNLAQGRIVYVKDQISYLERVTLLFIYAFCIRLQDEDYGFVRGFIERHLSMRCSLKFPYHWQETSPPEINSLRQKCYKRVTLSCHITYLTLSSEDTKEKSEDLLDRVCIFPFHRHKDLAKSGDLYLLKASSSVLLTLCTPEESESCEEEVGLLQIPQALWTVLVINCSEEFTSDHRSRQRLTPIAQYIRGITSSICTQRTNAESIYENLRKWLKDCDSDSIFDDEKFTKSTSYHWAVKTCDELSESIASTLRFIRRRMDSHVDKLCREAHAYERLGMEYWTQQMKEEIFALEDLQAQVIALRVQVQESRNALHGVTSILEARTALQQGERMKTLAYLATVYLPLTTAASLYSMSVLPKSASFLSFFVVLAILLLFTILLGLNLRKILHGFKAGTLIADTPLLHPLLKLFTWTKSYINDYLDLLNPYTRRGFDHSPSFDLIIYRIIRFIVYYLPIDILDALVLPEICMPIDQYIMYIYRNNPYANVRYHWIWFVKDVIRGALIPAWIGVAIGIVGYLVALDILGGFAVFVFKLISLLSCRKRRS